MRTVALPARVMTSALGLAVALTMTTASAAQASCMFDDRPLDEKIAEASIVFVGTVDNTVHGGTTASIEVEEIWKGPDLASTVTVIGGSGQEGAATSVDRGWETFTRYLIFPNPDGNQLHDNSCSATQPYSDDLAAFRPADARLVGAPSGEATPTSVTPSTDGEVLDGDLAADTSDGLPVIPIAAGVLVLAAAIVAVRGRLAKGRQTVQ